MSNFIGSINRNLFLNIAEEVVRHLLKLNEYNRPDRTGGFLVVRDKINDVCILKAEIGIPDKEGISRYWNFSEEKALRLHENQAKGHISSWQSRNPKNFQYGGAITAPDNSPGKDEGKDYILSFSGLPEHGDEAVCTVIAMIFRWLMLDDAEKIIKESGNPFIMPLIKACNHLF